MRNPIHPIIVNRFPSYVRSEYPNFFKLLSDFYFWLDENFLSHLSENLIRSEVNSEIDPFVSMIMREIGWEYELPNPGDKRLVANTLIDFYLSKGNEFSFEYLFRSIFNAGVTIDYPRKRLLTTSSAEYRSNSYVLVSTNSIGSRSYEYVTSSDSKLGMTIFGYVSGVEENVNEITPLVFGGVQYLLISIDSPGKFRPFETVHIDRNGVRILETIYNTTSLQSISSPGYGYVRGDEIRISGSEILGVARVSNITGGSITGIDIVSSGSGYSVGDSIIADPESITRGFGFFAIVKMVSVTGAIIEVEITNGGYEYEEIPRLLVRSSGGNGANLQPIPYMIGGISEIEFSEPYWIFGDESSITVLEYTISSARGTGATLILNSNECVHQSKSDFFSNRGVLGVNGVLHDSLYFQEYSYEVNSSVPPYEYESLVDTMVHPVGMIRYIIHNLDSKLKYNFNSLDWVKFHLDVPIDKFLSLTFEGEEEYKNYFATVESGAGKLSLGSYDGSFVDDIQLDTGISFIRQFWGETSFTHLSNSERIPFTAMWDTAYTNNELHTGFTFIRHYHRMSSMSFDFIQTYHQINQYGINEVTIG